MADQLTELQRVILEVDALGLTVRDSIRQVSGRVGFFVGQQRYVEIGNISPGLTYDADPSFWVTNNCSIFGVHVYEARHLREALSLLDRGRQRYPFQKIVSHRFPLEQVNEVMATQAEGHITRSSLVP